MLVPCLMLSVPAVIGLVLPPANAALATFEEVAPRLRELLRAQRQEQVAKAYVEGMFDTATLSIDGAALNQVLESSR